MSFWASLLIFFASFLAVGAQLPTEIDAVLKKELGSYKERLDKVIVVGDQKWLLTKPDTSIAITEDLNGNLQINQAIDSKLSLVLKTKEKDFLFSNGWLYTPITKKTIKSFDYYPAIMQDIILQSKIHQEFIVPKGFELPRDLAFLAGRIPMKLGSIELASDREELYEQKLKEIESQKPFQFLAYSYNSGNLTEIQVDKNSNEKLGEAKDLNAEKLGLKYLSSIKDHQGETYFSDLITGDIFRLKEDREDYDATKPSENEAEPAPVETNIEKIFSLIEIGVDDGVKDFEFNVNQSYLYVITKTTSKLLIIDYKNRVLTKKLDLPKMIDGFHVVSRSTQEPDKLVFFSKAKDTIFFLNTFDLRISDEIFLSKITKDSAFVPYSILVTYDKIFVGVEKISKTNYMSSAAGIMVFDSVTNAFQDFIELGSIPKEMILADDKESIFVLAESNSKTQVLKLSTDDYEKEAELELDADIAQVSSITEITDAKLLVVPSSVSSNIVLIDTEKLVTLKKISVNEPVSLLRVIN